MQTEVAVELGIMPTMPRRWQRKLQESGTPPADQASETARLRRGLDRTRMERDILKKAFGILSTMVETGFAEMPRGSSLSSIGMRPPGR